MQTKELKRVNPGTLVKQRVANIKNQLPRGYKQIIISNYPEYNTMKGATLINNVVRGRTTDVFLTEVLEQIVRGELSLKDSIVRG